MARSQYIYLIKYENPGTLSHGKILAGFTVKYEAHEWAKLAGYPINRMQLCRMRDGNVYLKDIVDIPWDHDFKQEYFQEPPKSTGCPEVSEESSEEKVRDRTMVRMV